MRVMKHKETIKITKGGDTQLAEDLFEQTKIFFERDRLAKAVKELGGQAPKKEESTKATKAANDLAPAASKEAKARKGAADKASKKRRSYESGKRSSAGR